VNLSFTPQAWDDYQYWLKTDQRIVKRIHSLIQDIQRTPYQGIGKREPLRHNLAGYRFRRITDEHRLVYKQSGTDVIFVQLRYHYK
jgi:toxin YoeB